MKHRASHRAQRHSVSVDYFVYDVKSGTQIEEHTKDLNLYGCKTTAESPFVAGTDVVLNMTCGEEKITAIGKVIFGRPVMGMGIHFATMEPHCQETIGNWIAELAIPAKSIKCFSPQMH
jgi:hypothetical protein